MRLLYNGQRFGVSVCDRFADAFGSRQISEKSLYRSDVEDGDLAVTVNVGDFDIERAAVAFRDKVFLDHGRVEYRHLSVAVSVAEDLAFVDREWLIFHIRQQIELTAVEGIAGAEVKTLFSLEERRAAVIIPVAEAVAGNDLEALAVGSAEEVKAPFVVSDCFVDVQIHGDPIAVDLLIEFFGGLCELRDDLAQGGFEFFGDHILNALNGILLEKLLCRFRQ